MSVGPIHHVAVVVRSIEEALPRYRDLFRLELVEPIDEDSGVARFLAARGEGVHHVCFVADDLPADLARLAAREAELIDREPRPGAHGTVAFVHPRTLNGVLWELLALDEHP